MLGDGVDADACRVLAETLADTAGLALVSTERGLLVAEGKLEEALARHRAFAEAVGHDEPLSSSAPPSCAPWTARSSPCWTSMPED